MLFGILNLALITSSKEDLFINLNTIISDFGKINMFVEIIAIFALIYIINELLTFTNVSNAVDTLIFKQTYRVQETIKLIASAFSTNIDFSNSNFFIDKKFYYQSFLMSTINIFSILSLELLFLLTFLNTEYVNVWASFFFFNFFIFIWIGKKIIDILNKKETKIVVDKNIIDFSRIKKTRISNKHYSKKYHLNKVNMLIPLVTNFVIGIILFLIFKISILTFILLYLILLTIELFVYVLYITYNSNTISEEDIYKSIVSALTYILNHILLLVLGFVILKTSQLLYSVYNPINLNFKLFLLILIVVTLITLFVRNYLFLLTMTLPFVLILFPFEMKLISFTISFSIYLFYAKNIHFKESSSEAVKEIFTVLIGGTISFIVLFYSNFFFAILVMLIYLFFIYFITNESSQSNVEN